MRPSIDPHKAVYQRVGNQIGHDLLKRSRVTVHDQSRRDVHLDPVPRVLEGQPQGDQHFFD
jgi:hypothetical protein